MLTRKTSRCSQTLVRPRGIRPQLEMLEPRLAPAGLSAAIPQPPLVTFDSATGLLSLLGPATAQVSASADGAVAVTVNGQAAATAATTARLRGITLSGGGSADGLTLGSLNTANALTIASDGALTVNGAVQAGGDLTLWSSDLLNVVSGSQLAAPEVTATADHFVNTGQLDAQATTGGKVFVQARDVLNAGTLSAAGTAGAGGLVWVSFTQSYIDTAAALTTASGTGGAGGRVRIDGGDSGRLFSSGQFAATGSVGGSVDLFGQSIALVAASVDASGTAGAGGQVRVGGDEHGATPNVPNAQTVQGTATTQLQANGSVGGAAGRIIIWSEVSTDFSGNISAQDAQGGQGGFVEVSSAGQLTYGGQTNSGPGGTLLLDPKNLVVSAAPTGVLPQFNLINPGVGGNFGAQVVTLSTGNLAVTDPQENSNVGAVYLFNGTTDALLSTLTGSTGGDQVGSSGVTALTNGNFVVGSSSWNGGRGAATWGNGTTGVSGVVSASNSLVGVTSGNTNGDQVGQGVTALSNGNYVVASPFWNGGRGAATWASGTAPTAATVATSNSIVGSNPDNGSNAGDRVGTVITALTNGNYVVASETWNGNRGAAMWANGTTGTAATVSASNSITGTTAGGPPYISPGGGDGIGLVVTALTNGNYVVDSSDWNNDVGAVTWASGTRDTAETVSPSNSIVGTTPESLGNPGDGVGIDGVTALTNGNYVVASDNWSGGTGAATWASGTADTAEAVSASNSIVGTFLDNVGLGGVTALTNGDYVVCSLLWNQGQGAATWANGTVDTAETVSTSNSIVGMNNTTNVQFPFGGVTALTNGNYVVTFPDWNGGAGAATWARGTGVTAETISASNSIVGTTPNSDQVGTAVTALTNGNYVVSSPTWNGGKGEATWASGAVATGEVVSASNSLVGTTANGSGSGDQVSSGGSGVTTLANGNYVVNSPAWNGSRGAVTWVNGTTGATLDSQHTIDAQNSVVGTVANAGLTSLVSGPVSGSFVAGFATASNGTVTVGLPLATLLTFANGQAQTITVTPSFLTSSLNAGTSVTLQANDDITISSPITVTPTGAAGSLTLQAGRSILLNASINTAGSNLTLTANQTQANGVVNAQRDSGNAVITMASGVTLTTGAGTLSVDLKTSTDKTNNGKGVATLLGLSAASTTLSAATVLGVTINGTTAGNGVTAGTFTQTNVTGALNLGSATLQLTQGTATAVGNTFTIVQTTGGVSGTFAGLAQGATVTANDGTTYTINYQANGSKDVVLTQTSVSKTLTVQGTSGNDTFTFTAGNPSQYSLNGVSHPVPAGVTSIHFVSNGGSDSATLTGQGNDFAALLPTDGALTANGITVDAANCTSVVVHAGGGNSTANFGTTTGADSYLGNPTYSAVVGNGFANYAVGFTHAHGFASGTQAIAFLVTSAANGDILGGIPAYSFVQSANDSYDSYAIGFKQVDAYSGGAGSIAYLGMSNGHDTFFGLPSYSAVTGTGYAVYAVGYHRTQGYSGGPNSTAILATSAGSDTYVGTPSYSSVQGANYLAYALGFAVVDAYSGGSNSVAFLNTSAGNDNYVRASGYSEAVGSGYTNFAIGFANVGVTAGSTNSVATFYDQPGTNTFTGSGSSAKEVGPGYAVNGSGFGTVVLHGTQGTDTFTVSNITYTFGHDGNWQ